MLEWLKENMLKEGYIAEEDIDLFIVTDDPAEAANHIIYSAQEQGLI